VVKDESYWAIIKRNTAAAPPLTPAQVAGISAVLGLVPMALTADQAPPEEPAL
jgi:hypothetical protein